MAKTITVSRLQPGQTFRFIHLGGSRGAWHTLAAKLSAKASGYKVLRYTDGTEYSCHGTNQVEVQ